jgi:hypothetical protein
MELIWTMILILANHVILLALNVPVLQPNLAWLATTDICFPTLLAHPDAKLENI